MTTARVLVLGCGYVGAEVARLALVQGKHVTATVRSPERAQLLRAESIAVQVWPELGAALLAPHIDAATHVIVAFPADGVSDARIAPALKHAGAISYVSSTGVYGQHRGLLDDRTALPDILSARSQRLINGEQPYAALAACVLRCPGIYGPQRGLHMRVLRGEHRIAGDGTRCLSRIHVADLAQLLLASGECEAARAQTFVVGDLTPAPQIEVVRFICETYHVPMPPQVALDQVPESLRVDRRVDPSRALATLGVSLRYPSYRQGMAPVATGIEPRLR